MMECKFCDKPPTCHIFMFVDGKDEHGRQNTTELAQICNDCVAKLLNHEIIIPAPNNALEWKDIISW